ncbi:MAG TPA: dolichyl-phosphate beta-glucosyltransferase [Candidatus Binatia bacterium]|nr:dolichyl-phosphate beta-glucosyltransferase [Candidatus Binatia bacterium]
MPGHHLDLSVIVPAFNEAKRLPKTLRRLHEYLNAGSLSYEILVVLDGPLDNTREVLQSLTAEIPRLKIADRRVNRGKGYTVKEGMLKASGRIRLFTDADNSTDIAHFEKMKPLFDAGCDVVIASRNSMDVREAQQSVSQVWYKRVMGHLGNLLVQLFAVRGIWDTQCGFKAFRAEAAQRIFSQATIDGWGFDIEILALARRLKYKIGIIPADWVNDDRSHFRWVDYFRVVGDIVKVRKNFLVGKYDL